MNTVVIFSLFVFLNVEGSLPFQAIYPDKGACDDAMTVMKKSLPTATMKCVPMHLVLQKKGVNVNASRTQ